MGSPGWLGKKNFAKLFPSYKADFLDCCHHIDSSIWELCTKLWIPKIWAGQWVHMKSQESWGFMLSLGGRCDQKLRAGWGGTQRWQISLGVWSGL